MVEVSSENITISYRGTLNEKVEWGVVIPEGFRITPSEIHEAMLKLLRDKGLQK